MGGGIAGVSAAYVLSRAGLRVVLLEANHIGTGETGYTTAFLTSSVDQPLSLLGEKFGEEHARRVRQVGEEAITRVEAVTVHEKINCGFHRLDAFLVDLRGNAVPHVEREADALLRAGADVHLLSGGDARFPTGAASALVRIRAQAEFDARAFLLGLAERALALGSSIFENTRMTGLEFGDSVRIRTPEGQILARHAVLATGLFPDPYRAQNRLMRQTVTYVSAVERLRPAGGTSHSPFLLWDATTPFHYTRFLDDLFLVGGEDRSIPEAAAAGTTPWEALETFAKTLVPGGTGTATHRWRGQILETADALPLVGAPKGGHPRVLLASGFGGNGMTFGTTAGVLVTDLITERLKPGDNLFRFGRPTLDSAA